MQLDFLREEEEEENLENEIETGTGNVNIYRDDLDYIPYDFSYQDSEITLTQIEGDDPFNGVTPNVVKEMKPDPIDPIGDNQPKTETNQSYFEEESGNIDGIPENCKDPVDFFNLLFKDLIEEIFNASNGYLHKLHTEKAMWPKATNPPWVTVYKNITRKDIELYISIFLFAGIVRCTDMKDLLKPRMYFPHFNKKLSYFRFRAIDRLIHLKGFATRETIDGVLTVKKTDFTWFIDYALGAIKKYYKPGTNISCDDDLYKWMGKGGLKKRIPGKADRVGNILWKVADSNKYIYHFIVEHLMAERCKIDGKILNEEILRDAENSLQRDKTHCFIIDAGLLGSMKNCIYLEKQNRMFLVSIASNKLGEQFPALFDNAKDHKEKYKDQKHKFTDTVAKRIKDLHAVKYGTVNNMTIMCWRAKPDKIVYWGTNITNPIENIVKTARSKDGFTQVATPRAAYVYNFCHNFVDASKMVINRYRNVQRARTFWRVIFHDVFYLMLYDTWILYKIKSTQGNPNAKVLSFKEYILQVVYSLSGEQEIEAPPTTVPKLIIENRAKCSNEHCHHPENRSSYKCLCHGKNFHEDCSIIIHFGLKVSKFPT